MNPWFYLLEKLEFRPTFPLVVAALQEQGLLSDSGDGYEDGLLLFQDIVNAEILDDRRKSVRLYICGALKVPTMELFDRGRSFYYKSIIPDEGKGKGRLCIESEVEPKRITDLDIMYSRMYDRPEFGLGFAFDNRRMSRDADAKLWVHHEDTPEFADAIAVLEDCEEALDIIGD